MILLIDNYDSFSYNLVQYISSVELDIRVIRNDACDISQIEEMHPEAIVLSPGPGRPADAGICIEAICYFKDKVPVLGVCLGHQAICEAFGGVVSYAKKLMHGKTSQAELLGKSPLFEGLQSPIKVARYHSLAAQRESLPPELIVTAQTADGEIMAVQHRDYPVYGVQFHPESVLTPDGLKIIQNFVNIAKGRKQA
ncbi:putative GMP synthase (glutamine-hydrolyzing) domain protein [Marvinbryantia formatexigens DSM 14469]|uniref:GMP synthase (Glutamine-hydrolyzing) domain protein n=1 Tax=Marvinbryantia formatexigens DSM 14469 TaxID=478749 RepID=C6LHT1_9FIRM|nr:aminodeoxychorismate/anthranilate synthase component II [Marvinbryantia formatexigens]EET59821.1 putative GMP synthase (glutamine-hydrolyzing) domain protein [Marvinbryantia formatexigens DSM 14469]UWO23313.1 aminodeoxychorismate/anthranilate synthase component II [Marvinbryantia formatexigens DSM 14469]SDG41918.1 anthranilate synthase, component II [Marvinbryantia formatexigens]